MRRAGFVLVVLSVLAAAFAIACGNSTSASPDAGAPDASPDVVDLTDAGDAANAADAHCLFVDDANVTHGCAAGGRGPGDRDDGGGAAPPLPDASPDATNLPFDTSCLNNAQCQSNVCFFYRVKGQLCTQICGSSADCPPASAGCNTQGICRVP